jgi:hypothetical protein
VILLIFNPKEIHSEYFLLEDKRLELMATQGEGPRPISGLALSESLPPALPDKKKQ